MKNRFVDDGTRAEIDQIVDRLHGDLRIRDDHVVLAEIRDLLKLDLQFYSSSDPSLLDHVIHKIKLGGKQILRRPTLLLDVVRKFDLTALFIPDRKRILLDSDTPDLKKRWNESHEIAHSVLPWHQEYLLGDTKETLSPSCHEQIEAEANYASGRLLYPNAALMGMARSGRPSLKLVRTIASHFKNTITSALWRYVELSDLPCAAIIGDHPQFATDDLAATHFVRSPTFANRFSGVPEGSVLAAIRGYCRHSNRGPLGEGEIVLTDDHGAEHIFVAESFGNTHQVLTLIVYGNARPAQIILPPALEEILQ